MEYAKALRLLSPVKTSWTPQILSCSALEKIGMEKIWESVKSYRKLLNDSGEWKIRRDDQVSRWMWSLVEEGLLKKFNNHSNLKNIIPKFEEEVNSGKMLPTTAAMKLLEKWEFRNK